jgi:DsbC/DsbD-like thiol-disulfide interchange protein
MTKIIVLFMGLLSVLSDMARAEGVKTAQLLPGWQEQDGTFMAGLQIDLLPEWKTYWRAPGAGGVPPVLDWTASQNVAQVTPIWPRPVVFRTDGVVSIGYHNGLVLPLRVTAHDPNLPVLLQGRVTVGVCKDICIPVTLDLHAELGGAVDPVIETALADVPMTAAAAGLTRITCQTAPIADGLRLTALIDLPDAQADDLVVLEPDDLAIWVSDAQMMPRAGGLTAVLDLVPPDAKPFDFQGQDMLVTILGPGRAVEIRGCP